jgi:hypothetical protein
MRCHISGFGRQLLLADLLCWPEVFARVLSASLIAGACFARDVTIAGRFFSPMEAGSGP